MRYCARCTYPENAKPYIIFDDEGVCSGCRVAESYAKVNWGDRRKLLDEILEEAKRKAEENNSHYHCIIPVSGGKDSHFQAHIIKKVYGLNPLFVTYNHLFNAPLGLRNLENMVDKFGCDLVRFSSSPDAVRKISRVMLEKVGDITWHYHAGILTLPIQMAVKFKIPLVIWAENNFSNLVGTFNPEDMVEFSRKARKDLGLRGIEIDELINDETGIEWGEVSPFLYPPEEDIEEIGVRGIYLSNFIQWNEPRQAVEMMDTYDFQPSRFKRERTFNNYSKLDDVHSNGVHDYLKYLKFGYGRATDDTSTLIRLGMMSREDGIRLIAEHDHRRPRDLDTYLEFVGMSEDQFYALVDPLRDSGIWEQDATGEWKVKDCVTNHVTQPGIEEARLPLNNSVDFSRLKGRYDMFDTRWLTEYEHYKYL